MNAPQSEREVALEARIKQLEEERAQREKLIARGGLFEMLWQTLTRIVPEWIAAAALAIWLGFHGFTYFVNNDMLEAEKQLSTAKADLEEAKANAASQPVDGGEALKIEEAKAELIRAQGEAIKANTEAEALATQEKKTTLAIATLDAEIDVTSQTAIKTRAQADALLYQEGGATLAEREIKAQATIDEMDAAAARVSAALAHGNARTITAAACQNNKFGYLLNCPN